MQPIPSIFPLVPKVMHYDWGNRGAASAVARLALPQAQIDAAKPYAELWMGTHPNAPSTALLPTSDPVDLLTLIRAHPTQLLGDALCHSSSSSGEEPHDLPFLFKVLSVAKPLSIQAHPDKHLARRLHVHSPQHYKDANHKPEMAIALTEFHALFGFRPSAEIVHHLRAYPELADVASEPAVNAFVAHVESGKPSDGSDNYNKQALRALFTAIMSASPTLVATHLTALITRLSSSPTSSPIDTLLLSTHAHFPNDVGLLCILLMNHITLHPGQAMYMGANELHAYLSGDCIEVMATSDNVVRAGLTPKFKDVETLTSMLTYTQGGAGAGMLAPVAHAEGGGRVVVYDPPIEEFAVHRTEATSGEDVGVPVVHGPSVVLVTEGSGELRSAEGGDGPRVKVKPGSVVFVVPGTRVTLRAAEGGNGKVVVYQALCEAATPEKQQAGSKL